MNKKKLVSLLTLVLVLVSLVTVAFATGTAQPEGEVYWYHKVLAVLTRPEAMIVLMIVIFYFLLIRPENKRKKETANMRNNLKNGDEITTIGGIIGRVTNVKDDEITIETSPDANKIRLTKWAVSSVNVKK